jgi:prefoldin alpha subunit
MEQALISTRAISPDSEGRAMLVPLTGSLYAPGKLVDCDKVLVDVGTGYFVEKSQKEAIAYLVEKLEKLQEREQQVHLTLMRKRESQATVVDLMQKRIAGLSTAKAPVMH